MPEPADDEVKTVFERHRKELLRYACRFVPADEAEDVLQDVFIALLKHKRSGAIRSAEQLAWLYRACHNRAIDYLRRKKRLIGEERLALLAAPTQEKKVTWPEIRALVYELSAQLDRNGSGSLLLHLLEEGTPRHEIARLLKISERTLRRKVARLFRFLEQELLRRGITGING
ncbi:MAG: sigma-70 family RNA polymerase sigma factor [Turneriella sp.]|nr:sigma-70 family RNA polymerase sigma factor [Turneriella sp.]